MIGGFHYDQQETSMCFAKNMVDKIEAIDMSDFFPVRNHDPFQIPFVFHPIPEKHHISCVSVVLSQDRPWICWVFFTQKSLMKI